MRIVSFDLNSFGLVCFELIRSFVRLVCFVSILEIVKPLVFQLAPFTYCNIYWPFPPNPWPPSLVSLWPISILILLCSMRWIPFFIIAPYLSFEGTTTLIWMHTWMKKKTTKKWNLIIYFNGVPAFSLSSALSSNRQTDGHPSVVILIEILIGFITHFNESEKIKETLAFSLPIDLLIYVRRSYGHFKIVLQRIWRAIQTYTVSKQLCREGWNRRELKR